MAFVVQPSASKMPSTQLLSAQTSSRAEFIQNVATASIASVMVSVPKIAGADDAGDLSMPTPEEQKQEVSKDTDCIIDVILASKPKKTIKTTLISTLQVSLGFHSVLIELVLASLEKGKLC